MITINRHTLSNGLRILHHEDPLTRMVALNLLYDVGARDEDAEHTGFAHLFEHLMFGGSVHIPDYDTPVQNAGGESNAWTSNDLTNYYVTLPRQNVEIAFWLESDRMAELDFHSQGLEVQRQVVMEEFKQRHLNQPYGDVFHLLRSLAYTRHPYRWPAIGRSVDHIARATLDEVKDFFHRFYAPDNAILAVTGSISFEETVRLAEKWFAPIPPCGVSKRNLPKEPPQTVPRRLEVERDVPVDALYMAFHTCAYGQPDYVATDMLSDILSNGKSSRLEQELVRNQRICTSADAYITGSLDEGLLCITAKPVAGRSLVQVEEAVWKELGKLKNRPVPEEEIEKVKNRHESEFVFNNLHYLNVAASLAYHELAGKAEEINDEIPRYRNTTATTLQQVATRIFRPENGCTLLYKACPGCNR